MTLADTRTTVADEDELPEITEESIKELSLEAIPVEYKVDHRLENHMHCYSKMQETKPIQQENS